MGAANAANAACASWAQEWSSCRFWRCVVVARWAEVAPALRDDEARTGRRAAATATGLTDVEIRGKGRAILDASGTGAALQLTGSSGVGPSEKCRLPSIPTEPDSISRSANGST